MSLADRILVELSKSPRKASQLARTSDVDSAHVNRLLYGELAPVVERGDDYVWRLRPGVERVADGDPVAARCMRLLSYFSECVFLDTPAPELTGLDVERRLRIFATASDAADQRQWCDETGRPPFSIGPSDAARLGLGLVVVREPVAGGQMVVKCAPLLMSRPLGALRIEAAEEILSQGWTVNTTALRLAGHGHHADALIDHAVEIERRIEIDACRTLGDLADLCERLQDRSEVVPWISTAEFSGNTPLSAIAQAEPRGIARPCIFSSPASKITEGLLEELKCLKGSAVVAAQPSALRFAMGGPAVPSESQADRPLLEPVPLNEEQRHAVRAALERPWTVIQGPPGTGKSQVVSAILANAAWRGQRVLFASKNNAAVDVVVERLNGLATEAAVLRVGSSQAMSALEQQVRSLLGGHATPEERAECESARSALEAAHAELARRESALDVSDRLAAEVMARDVASRQARAKFGSERFHGAAAIDPEVLEASLAAAGFRWAAADRRQRGALAKVFWFAMRRRRIERARAASAGLETIVRGVIDASPAIPGEEEARVVDRAFTRIAAIRGLRSEVAAARAFGLAEAAFAKGTRIEAACAARDHAVVKVKEASLRLWRAWLRITESRLPPELRQRLGALLALLQEFRTTGHMPWSNYYNALEAAVQVLPLWATTSLSARKRLPLSAGCFDLVVIDEASQCDIASALPLLYRAKRAVIIGDSNQLSHITSIPTVQAIRLTERFGFTADDHAWSYASASLLDRALSLPGDRVTRIGLREHFRCHPDIVGYSNESFYDGRLIVRTRRDRLRTVENHPPLRWIEVEGRAFTRQGTSLQNREEAEAIVDALEDLLARDSTVEIGVCAPFRAQVELIRRLARDRAMLGTRLESEQLVIDTVHRFQGNERDVIVFSPTIAAGASPSSVGFLSRSRNIFNVAVTRARAHLLVVGDRETCRRSGVEYLARFVEYCERATHRSGSGAAPGTTSDGILSDVLRNRGFEVRGPMMVDEYILDCVVEGPGGPVAVERDDDPAARCKDPAARRRDLARWERLRELGWNLVRVAPHELEDNPERIERRVREAMKQVPAGLGR